MAELLYNIPCVHRAYCITFSKPEIFVPISKPVFVKKDNSKEAWIKLKFLEGMQMLRLLRICHRSLREI